MSNENDDSNSTDEQMASTGNRFGSSPDSAFDDVKPGSSAKPRTNFSIDSLLNKKIEQLTKDENVDDNFRGVPPGFGAPSKSHSHAAYFLIGSLVNWSFSISNASTIFRSSSYAEYHARFSMDCRCIWCTFTMAAGRIVITDAVDDASVSISAWSHGTPSCTVQQTGTGEKIQMRRLWKSIQS